MDGSVQIKRFLVNKMCSITKLLGVGKLLYVGVS
jgi:hypothetical protein